MIPGHCSHKLNMQVGLGGHLGTSALGGKLCSHRLARDQRFCCALHLKETLLPARLLLAGSVPSAPNEHRST